MSSQYGDNFCEIVVKSDFQKQIYGPDMILLQGHAVTLTFKLQGIDLNVVRDTSSHYGDNFCNIVLKSNFKKPSYSADTILLQGHAVPLTFKVATQILHVTRHLNMVIISVK